MNARVAIESRYVELLARVGERFVRRIVETGEAVLEGHALGDSCTWGEGLLGTELARCAFALGPELVEILELNRQALALEGGESPSLTLPASTEAPHEFGSPQARPPGADREE